MGPIERELRRADARDEWGFALDASPGAWKLAVGACRNLGFKGSTLIAYRAGCLPDVLSEAIEAAEALGL